MTEPTLPDQLQTAIDELDMAHNTMIVALDSALALGLAPFRLTQLDGAMSDTKHAIRDLHELATALAPTDADHKP